MFVVKELPFLLGERFISYIDRDTLNLVLKLLSLAIVKILFFSLKEFTNDSSKGLKEVQDGKAYGHIVIPTNYTKNYLFW